MVVERARFTTHQPCSRLDWEKCSLNLASPPAPRSTGMLTRTLCLSQATTLLRNISTSFGRFGPGKTDRNRESGLAAVGSPAPRAPKLTSHKARSLAACGMEIRLRKWRRTFETTRIPTCRSPWRGRRANRSVYPYAWPRISFALTNSTAF